jgi:hypothetical protein
MPQIGQLGLVPMRPKKRLFSSSRFDVFKILFRVSLRRVSPAPPGCWSRAAENPAKVPAGRTQSSVGGWWYHGGGGMRNIDTLERDAP